MVIERLEFFHVVIPLAHPFYPAWAPGYAAQTNHFTLLRMTTDDGIQGLATGLLAGREHDALAQIIAPYLLGVDPTQLDKVHQHLHEASLFGWRNFWIEAACWDITAKAVGLPVWALLGGAGADQVSVYASLGEIHPPEQRAEETLKLMELGFETVKLRVHGAELADDVAQVAAVRRAVGDGLAIGVDANQAWRLVAAGPAPRWTLERAQDFAHACADLEVRWLEEPLDLHAYADLAQLTRGSQVPIAGGELNGGWHEFKVMLQQGCYDIYQPDAIFGGGITDAVQVLRACRERGLGFTPHTWSNGLGFLINLHVYLAGDRQHALEYPFDPPSWTPEFRDGILAEPITVSAAGQVTAPGGPGFGIVIDDDKLAHFGTKIFDNY